MELNKHIGGELRLKPKRRVRSARDFRSKPESKAKPKIERGGVGERARCAHLQKIFENSYLKPCNLVYSSSENPSFPRGGSWNLPKMGTDLISIPAKFSYISLRAL